MKNLLLVCLIVIHATGMGRVEQLVKQNNIEGPEITFDKESYSFGELTEGSTASCLFLFTNTGNKPLIISDVSVSCDCTVPQWSAQPVLAGQTGTITVSYHTGGRVYPFNKSIRVISNAKTSTKVLYINGEVVKGKATSKAL